MLDTKLLFHPSAKTCVLSCPEELSQSPGADSCFTCAEVGGDNLYWDPDREKCVATCPETSLDGKCVSCAEADKSGARPIWNAEHQICQSCAEAFPNEKRTWDPNTHQCVQNCPDGLVDTDTGKCLSCSRANGGAPLVWDEAAKKCAPCPPETPNWDGEHEKCAPPCPTEMPAWTYVCLLKTYVCASCETATNTKRPFWDPNAQECVEMCPSDTPAAENEKTCQTCAQANTSAPYWNPATRECVAKCPGLTVDGRCKPCSDADAGKPFWDGKACQSCPDGDYWDPNRHICVYWCDIRIADQEKKLCFQCGEG